MNLITAIITDIRKGKNLEVYAILVISIVVLGLDVFGTIKLEIFMEVILAVLSLLAVSTITTRNSLAKLPDQLGVSLKGISWEEFRDTREFLEYINYRLGSPGIKIVHDLSWSSFITFDDRDNKTRKAAKDHWRIAGKIGRNHVYKEVFMFNRRGRLDKLRKKIEEDKSNLYFCGYYPNFDIPLLQFMVIDEDGKDEVIFFNGKYPSLAIRHPKLVEIFKQYYDDIWDGAIKLRDKDKVYTERINKILETETSSYDRVAG